MISWNPQFTYAIRQVLWFWIAIALGIILGIIAWELTKDIY